MTGRTSYLPEGAARVPPSRAKVGTEGHPPSGSAHLHTELLVLLLQALEFLLQGVVLEVLLQGQRGLVPAQPGDSRDGLSTCSAGRVGLSPHTLPTPPAPRHLQRPNSVGLDPQPPREGKECGQCYPRDGDGSCPTHRGSSAPGEWQDRDPHSRCGGGGGGLALLRCGGVEVEKVIPHGDLVAQLSNLERQSTSGHGRGDLNCPQGGTQGAKGQTCAQELLPPLWPIPAAPPGAHCARSGSGSASAGTAQCVLPTPGPALSARGRAASAGTHPFPSPHPPRVPRVPPALTRVGSPTYLVQQVGDGVDIVVGLRDPDHPLSTQDWGRGPEGEPQHRGSTDPGAQHCPPKAAPGWPPKRTFCLLGGTSHIAGQGSPQLWQHHGKRGSHLPPTLPSPWSGKKNSGPPG